MPQAPVRRRRATREVISGDRVGARRAGIVHAPVRRNVPWEDAATDFLRDKKGEGRSGATFELYESYLSDSRIAAWRTDHGIEDIGDVTAESLKALRDELIDAGLSLQGGCERPPAGDARLPPLVPAQWVRSRSGRGRRASAAGAVGEHRAGHDLEAPERTLYQAARSDRDRFLLRFMINTGLRVSEVEGITLQSIEEIDLPDGTRERILRVRQGKGRKDRHVPLNTRAFPRFDREIADYVRACGARRRAVRPCSSPPPAASPSPQPTAL